MEEVWPVRRIRGSLFPGVSAQRPDSFPSASPGFCPTNNTLVSQDSHAIVSGEASYSDGEKLIADSGVTGNCRDCQSRASALNNNGEDGGGVDAGPSTTPYSMIHRSRMYVD